MPKRQHTTRKRSRRRSAQFNRWRRRFIKFVKNIGSLLILGLVVETYGALLERWLNRPGSDDVHQRRDVRVRAGSDHSIRSGPRVVYLGSHIVTGPVTIQAGLEVVSRDT